MRLSHGHGLSYTTFSYANLKLSKTNADLKSDYSAAYTVELDITNSGKRAGAEVVQVYLGVPSTGAVPQPPEKLAGFARIGLKPGEKHHVSIPLQGRSLAYWDVKSHDWKLAGKSFQVMVGASSRDIRLRGRWTYLSDGPSFGEGTAMNRLRGSLCFRSVTTD